MISAAEYLQSLQGFGRGVLRRFYGVQMNTSELAVLQFAYCRFCSIDPDYGSRFPLLFHLTAADPVWYP